MRHRTICFIVINFLISEFFIMVETTACNDKFKLTSSGASWEIASQSCGAGKLAVIPSLESFRDVHKCTGDTPAWIGARYMNSWTWLGSNKPLAQKVVANFDSNMPFGCGVISIARNSIRADRSTAELFNIACNESHAYICQKPGCQLSTRKCLSIAQNYKTWDQARKVCHDSGMDLVMLDHEFENETRGSERYKIFKEYLGDAKITADFLWVGLHNLPWKWISGEPVMLPNEMTLVQNSSSECLLMNGTSLVQANCDERHPYVCQQTTYESANGNRYDQVGLILIFTFAPVAFICAVVMFVYLKRRWNTISKVEGMPKANLPTQAAVIYTIPHRRSTMNEYAPRADPEDTLMVENDMYGTSK